MKDKYTNTIMKVMNMELELRKYAHAPGCTAYTHCPSSHSNCKENLGLDTSIAWELANELNTVHEYLQIYFRNQPFFSTKKIEETISKVEIITSAFSSVLYRHNYRVLSYIINDVYPLLDLVRSLLKVRRSKRLNKKGEKTL